MQIFFTDALTFIVTSPYHATFIFAKNTVTFLKRLEAFYNPRLSTIGVDLELHFIAQQHFDFV